MTASLRFKFQKRIYIIHKKSNLACFGVVLRNLILVNLLYFEYHLPLFNGQSHLIHYRRTGEGTIHILSMHIFLTWVGGEDILSTQAKHAFIITSERDNGVIQLLLQTIEHLIRPSIRKHASISLHASPTWMIGWHRGTWITCICTGRGSWRRHIL